MKPLMTNADEAMHEKQDSSEKVNKKAQLSFLDTCKAKTVLTNFLYC